jgi:hypothetical protein
LEPECQHHAQQKLIELLFFRNSPRPTETASLYDLAVGMLAVFYKTKKDLPKTLFWPMGYSYFGKGCPLGLANSFLFFLFFY